MKTRTNRHWILVVLFTAMCIAAIATDCTASGSRVWVSYLSSRLSQDLDGTLGGVSFQLHVSLASPFGLTIESSATR
ncbi:MAG TPA: hypothetical protein VFD36_27250 [Kofleriaceae bacterium]|jgi:hypothetical protein|nr:hypothetical protein [Kofleriaceae bacterium]